MSILNKLKLNNVEVISIKSSTRNQVIDPEWFKHRKKRLTAPLSSRLGSNDPLTSKGFKTLARYHVIHDDEKQKSIKIIQFKLPIEPIAIKSYESYAKLKRRKTVVESCALATNSENLVLGAATNREVVFETEFGIFEVKCSEKYSNVDPKDICFISKYFYRVFDDATEKMNVNKNHTYYEKIQMQLALTTQSWCDCGF